MEEESILDTDNLIEEEYGSGNELSTTGFFIFGLLTFWIYNVWNYHKILSHHFNSRLKYFTHQLASSKLSSENNKELKIITEKGFKFQFSVKYILSCLYFLSMSLIFSEVISQYLVAYNYISIFLFDIYTFISIGLAALLFCISSVWFLSWICKTIKNHEYYEMLFAKLNQDPDHFKMVKPSNNFVKRWNRNQNWVAFFLILSIPMTISPVIAIKHIYDIIYSGQPFGQIITIWSIILFTLAGTFHLWGTQILINMYNGHLRIETVNQQHLIKANPWLSEKSSSVLAETTKENEIKINEDLVPNRSLAAIVLTDIVGFSKEMEKDEEGTYSKLLLHNEIIRKIISTYKGEEIKTIGDAFLVRFKSAVDAVKAAMNIQKEFFQHNKDKEESKKILVRIGIHIGDILIMNNDIFGNGVNIASRIEPLAEPGGICISADVYNVVKKTIDIKVLNLGKKELKNIADSPEIFKILIDSNTLRLQHEFSYNLYISMVNCFFSCADYRY